MRMFLAGGALLLFSSSQLVSMAAAEPFTKFRADTGGGSETLGFGDVPNNRRFEIESVSCWASLVPASAEVLAWTLVVRNGLNFNGTIELQATKLATLAESVTYSGTESALLVAQEGRILEVIVGVDGGSAAQHQCTVSGQNRPE